MNCWVFDILEPNLLEPPPYTEDADTKSAFTSPEKFVFEPESVFLTRKSSAEDAVRANIA